MSEKYNGWTNYETWLANLWLTGDESTYRDLLRITQEVDSVENLKYYVTESVGLNEASLRADLLSSALSEVNWCEIVEVSRSE